MGLFRVLFLCAAIPRTLLHYNSRFDLFNSRLGANKFPFSWLRELAGKRLTYFDFRSAETVLFAEDRENSRFHGNNRELRAQRGYSSALTISSVIFLASPNSIIVLSR
jgi:hypothetical protein